MKRLALMFVLLIALAAPAFAINGVGDISVYADEFGNSCNVTNPGSGFMSLYVVHKFLPGEESTGSRFSIILPAGLSAAAFNTTFVPVGNIASDLSLGYGVCVQGTTLLGTIFTAITGPSPACSYITVQAAQGVPGVTEPLGTDCQAAEKVLGVGQAIVNPDAGCQCNIAVEATSWGKVKALYR